MRGRRPKPTALKLIEGNPGKRPLPKDEPTPPVGATKPKGLGAVASRKWDELAPLLTESRILTVVDAGALEAYCVAYEEYELAGQEIEKNGLTILNRFDDTVENPCVATRRKALNAMRQWAIELGMTPASRSRVTRAERPMRENKFAAVDTGRDPSPR